MPITYFDNTRVSCAKNCLRQYYLRHILDWRREGKSPALAFGSAWHEAMDVVWGMAKNDSKSDMDILAAAMFKFNEKWTEEGFPSQQDMGPEEEDNLAPRTPGIAAEMLHNYIQKRRPFLKSINLISIEQPFAVPIFPDNPDILYIGRFDKIFEYEGKIIIGEHKTTSSYKKDGPFRTDYLESWSPNSQVDGYLYSANMLYGNKEDNLKVSELWIDAALVHKKIHDGFKFIPISRAMGMMDAWLYETRWWIETIMEEKRIGSMPAPDIRNDFLSLYPKNTGACNHYAGCGFRDVCKMISNPAKEPCAPLGYIEEHWEPFDLLGIDKLGLPKPNGGK